MNDDGDRGMSNESESARSGRRPSVVSIVFFALLAALGLLGATRAGGGGATEVSGPGTRSGHLSWAKSYREKAAVAQREADVHRALAEGAGTAAGEAMSPEAFHSRCRRLAAAAAELSRVENELAQYHEDQARLLPMLARQGP
jgi:hypothetical protein